MKTLEPQRQDLTRLKLIIKNQIDYYSVQSIRLYLRPWQRKEVEKALYLLKQQNKGLTWQFQMIDEPPR